jgi:hypothetical protein
MFQIQDAIAAANYQSPDGTYPAEGGAFGDAFHWFGPPSDAIRLAWEWGGEWTVTFETFRDMGAAFMVALVLIYILVVWEFGNFRIPLVIMAPIPLTLLGIIPAHFIMFQLGWGGEFTATSMIGWIALAGIIVRNSILLVDFSIHEIQRGIPVAEAVIRACKIRTRPILITALALVAGSSVIITDPIFQGMAISLLAGTLVSTVLTLIVIPLGCVAASRDMCEVAAASSESLPASGLPCQIEEEQRSPAKSKREGGGLSVAVAKVVEVVTLIFYALRGLVLLLVDLIKGAMKPKPSPRPKPGGPPPGGRSSPPAPSTPAGGGSGAVTPAAEGSASSGAAAAPNDPEPATASASASAPPAESPPPVAREVPVIHGVSAETAPTASEGAVDQSIPVEAGPARVELPPQPIQVPSTAKPGASAPASGADTGSRPPAGARKTRAKSAGSGRKGGNGKRATASKSETPAKARPRAAKPVVQTVQKKAPRRGIRLKIDEGTGGEDR